MFSPNAVSALSRQSSSSASKHSNGNSPAVASSPDALVATTGVLSVTQQLSSGTTNDRVSPLIFLSPNAGASASTPPVWGEQVSETSLTNLLHGYVA